MKKLLPLYFLALLLPAGLFSQNCSNLNIQHRADIASTCTEMVMTMRQDVFDRPYLYVANKEAGLKIYDISSLSSPVAAASVPVSSLSNQHVMNVWQDGNYLYLALGNHFNNSQNPGLAIVDVTNPAQPVLTDVWTDAALFGGAGIVRTEGGYAYLGAMGNGLITLDIADKTDIKFVSRFMPDINYPTANPDPDLYNARGMAVRNNLVYLCFDAGGLRIIDMADKQNPVEKGRYSNPVMNGKPRAYNNIVLDDTLAYIAVDYCGLEVLNVSSPAAITLAGWWNPWNCHTSPANWFSSPGHANEIESDKPNKLLFISTGKSDLYVVGVANPNAPDSCTVYGGVGNNIGTWGVGLHNDRIFLSYICAVIPFSSNWTGVKNLTYNRLATGIETTETGELKVYPVPADDRLFITLDKEPEAGNIEIKITNSIGQQIDVYTILPGRDFTISTSGLPAGVYTIMVIVGNRQYITRFIK